MGKFYRFPFAESGDKVAVPDGSQGNGAVSYQEGYGSRYSLDVTTDPSARRIDRPPFNQLLNDITSNLREWQIGVYPAFIAAADNGGAPYPYAKGAIVTFSGDYKISVIDNNLTDPTNTTNWKDAFPLPVELGGTGTDDIGNLLPSLGLGTAAVADVGIGAGNVPSVAQADFRYAQAENNLSDLTDAAQARQNLGITDGFELGDVVASYEDPADLLSKDFLPTGTTVSRTTYAELFALLGDKAGPGDGSTTFDIPYVGRLGGSGSSEGDWTNIGSGSGAPSWGYPDYIALDQGNKDVYVADDDLNQIWKKDGSTGLWTNIGSGSGAPSWSFPHGIAVDQSTKDVYVADSSLNQIWKKDGSSGAWTNISGGSGAPSWSSPYDIALDQSTKDVYVTDSSLDQIWKKDGSTGSWTNISVGSGAPSWSAPYGIALDQGNKDVYVTDSNLSQIWKKDGSTGSWTNISGGTGAPSWNYPYYIAVDQGNKDVYVTDWGLSQIWKKDGSTGSWTNISGGTGAPSWGNPRGIALDQGNKDVYVTDATLDQIWKQKNIDPSAPYYIKAK